MDKKQDSIFSKVCLKKLNKAVSFIFLDKNGIQWAKNCFAALSLLFSGNGGYNAARIRLYRNKQVYCISGGASNPRVLITSMSQQKEVFVGAPRGVSSRPGGRVSCRDRRQTYSYLRSPHFNIDNACYVQTTLWLTDSRYEIEDRWAWQVRGLWHVCEVGLQDREKCAPVLGLILDMEL